jgi:hypothetical protein
MSKCRTSSTSASRPLALAGLLFLAASFAAQAADVSVVDEWEKAGRVSLRNEALTLVFSKQDGSVRVHDMSTPNGIEVMSLVPVGTDGERATGIVACKVGESSNGRAECQVTFSTRTTPIEAGVALNSAGAIQVTPSPSLKAISVSAAFKYGVLPSRQLDDNVYVADDYPRSAALNLPSESLFVGLLDGCNRVLVAAWPPGDQSVRLVLTGEPGKRRIDALELTLAGSNAFFGVFSAPGVWHEVTLDSSYEEQDQALDWEPPFAAAWRVQLTELGVPTAFRLRSSREKPWRPTVGFFIYPFFRENGKVLLNLHKKLESSGRALIYALEGHEKTPYSFLTANLSPDDQRRIVELYPVLSDYELAPEFSFADVIMNSHCAGRDQLKYTTLTVGAQGRDVPFLDTHIDDRARESTVIATYSVERALRCMDDLDKQLGAWLDQNQDNAPVRSFLRQLKGSLETMQQEYRERLAGRSPDDMRRHIAGVARQFRAAIREGGGLELCPEILADINELNAVISLEEDATRRFGTSGRSLFQEAGYACVADPTAAKLAEKIRGTLREQMRYRYAETPNGQEYPRSLLPAD